MILILEVVSPRGLELGGASRQAFHRDGGTIGRDRRSTWVLTDPKVSGLHARITCRESVFYIEDKSRNGVFLNGRSHRLTRDVPHPLAAGDRLTIDPYEIRVSIEGAADAVGGGVAAASPGRGRPAVDDPFQLDPADPFGAGPAPVGEPALDPLALLNLGGPAVPPRRPPSAEDLHGGDILEEAYRAPDVLAPPVPSRAPEPPSPGAPEIPPDYNPLADESQVFRVAVPTPGGPRQAAPLPSAFFPAPPPVRQPPPPAPVERRETPVVSPPPEAAPPVLDLVAASEPLAPFPPVAPPVPMAPAPSDPAPLPVFETSDTGALRAFRSEESSLGLRRADIPPVDVIRPPVHHPPPVHQPPPVPMARSGGGAGDLGAVLEGAGLDPALAGPELGRQLGQILRVVVAGVMAVMESRIEVKDEFGMKRTRFMPAENNPLKFSANVDDALHNLLVKRNPAYLGPVAAFEDAFADLTQHQVAMLAGIRRAFEFLLAEFDPDRLQQEFDRQGGKGLVPGKLRYWDQYRERLHALVKDPDACFSRLFGDEFARAYADQLARLKASAAGPAPRPEGPDRTPTSGAQGGQPA